MSEEKLTEETLKAQEEEKERQRWLQVKYPCDFSLAWGSFTPDEIDVALMWFIDDARVISGSLEAHLHQTKLTSHWCGL